MQPDIVSVDFDGAKFLHRRQEAAQWYLIQEGAKKNNNNLSLELRIDKSGGKWRTLLIPTRSYSSGGLKNNRKPVLRANLVNQ